MLSAFPLTLCCISLLCLQQLLALPVAQLASGSRLNILNKLFDQDDGTETQSGSQTDVAVPTSAAALDRPGRLQHGFSPRLSWARPTTEDSATERRAPRARRHAHSGSRGGHHHPHPPQLMRVGCVLGTCQVQNLSHRLYQLIGQSGREESSPINPRSPHSYG
ncbi:protein ADM2a [Synchiropus splendidus]|uniref:protein ADM2a n=1 Tax=Synchiropus splendidus TaxID=270530 RepID=UPI00237E948E|nr:protein ADM2a [Synchiropus splendidus]